MYLVDTNVWLEHFLQQAKAEEGRELLDRALSESIVPLVLNAVLVVSAAVTPVHLRVREEAYDGRAARSAWETALIGSVAAGTAFGLTRLLG